MKVSLTKLLPLLIMKTIPEEIHNLNWSYNIKDWSPDTKIRDAYQVFIDHLYCKMLKKKGIYKWHTL